MLSLACDELRPDWDGGALNTATVMFAWTPPATELEPSDGRELAQAISAPTLVNGRFDWPADVDWYQFAVAPGEEGKYTLQITLPIYCERLVGRADSYVKIEDEKGARLFDRRSLDPGIGRGKQDRRGYGPRTGSASSPDDCGIVE